MWTDLSLTPLTEDDLGWATALERRVALTRRWTVGGFVPHPGVHADVLANGAEHLLVARGRTGDRHALVWVYRRGERVDHAYLSLLADPHAPPGFAVLALAGAIERHLTARPDGRILVEVAEPNLRALGRIVDAAFDEVARLRRAAWMDGAWHDVSVWACDGARWRSLVGPADRPATVAELVDRWCPRPPAVRPNGPVLDGDPIRALLTTMADRDPGCVMWTPGDPRPDLDERLEDHLVLDSLGSLVLATTVAELAGLEVDDVVEDAAGLITFGDLVELVGRNHRAVA